MWPELGPRGRRQFQAWRQLHLARLLLSRSSARRDVGLLRLTDAQTPGLSPLTWQVWAGNQASGCTALCVLALFMPSQGGEGWDEATAKLWGGSCTVSSSLSCKEPRAAGAEWGGREGTSTQMNFSQGKRRALEGVVQTRQVMV